MNIRTIAIEREYGSGGTAVARACARALGIPCYGEEIAQTVAKKYNVSVDQIERYEESVTGSFLYSLYMFNQVATASDDMVTLESHVFLAEQKVIRELAGNGPAIFLGHCTGIALKDTKGLANVYIRANSDFKQKRVVQDYEIASDNAATIMKRYDKKRANYYYANTGRRWDDLHNYDIVLDTSRLGIDGCVRALVGLMTSSEN